MLVQLDEGVSQADTRCTSLTIAVRHEPNYMMRCPDCGADLDGGARPIQLCPKWGSKRSDARVRPPTAEANTEVRSLLSITHEASRLDHLGGDRD